MSGFRLEVAAGASRSGKTHLTAQRIKNDRNIFIWDSMAEFSQMRGYSTVSDGRALRRHAAAGAAGRFAFVVPVTRDNFDLFCRCASTWLKIHDARGRTVTIVVEELADVTSPGKAQPAWGVFLRTSLRFNPSIYVMTQRPAESDKTVMGNATVLRCHSMHRADDRRYMAKELDTDQARVDALDFSRYQYIERDRLTRRLSTGGLGIKTRIIR